MPSPTEHTPSVNGKQLNYPTSSLRRSCLKPTCIGGAKRVTGDNTTGSTSSSSNASVLDEDDSFSPKKTTFGNATGSIEKSNKNNNNAASHSKNY